MISALQGLPRTDYEEIILYSFTINNVKQPSIQVRTFLKAYVDSVRVLKINDADLLLMGSKDN